MTNQTKTTLELFFNPNITGNKTSGKFTLPTGQVDVHGLFKKHSNVSRIDVGNIVFHRDQFKF